VSGQLHAPATLPPGKEPVIPTGENEVTGENVISHILKILNLEL
jgi:hypothetical protein